MLKRKQRENSSNILNKLYIYIKPFLNWRFLICFLIPWSITNGIWYVGLWIGTKFRITWLATTCGAYIVNLYMPWACEKVLIIPIAIWLCKVLFKSHKKTHDDLQRMFAEAKRDLKTITNKLKGKEKNARKRNKPKLRRRSRTS